MTTLTIVGYEKECNCEHCGRVLKHGIRISDGRVVGAQCLNQSMTKPKVYQGKSYRIGSELIIRAAKVVQFYNASKWGSFGVSSSTIQFDAA